MTLPDPAAPKEDWRRWARRQRESLDWAAASTAITEALLSWEPLRVAATALVFLPMAEEVNLQPLMDSDLACRWLTTRTPPLGEVLTIHELGGPLEVHSFGFLQPHRSAPEVHPLDVERKVPRKQTRHVCAHRGADARRDAIDVCLVLVQARHDVGARLHPLARSLAQLGNGNSLCQCENVVDGQRLATDLDGGAQRW